MKKIWFVFFVYVLNVHAQKHMSKEPLPDAYSHCNETINKIFAVDSNYPYGFIRLDPEGSIVAAECAEGGCKIKNFSKNDGVEVFDVSQNRFQKPNENTIQQFVVKKEHKKITSISSGGKEIAISFISGKCVPTHIISNNDQKGVREVDFDLLACKTNHELRKAFKTGFEKCVREGREVLNNTKDIKTIGQQCRNELETVYRSYVSEKKAMIDRYSKENSLKRKPFKDLDSLDFNSDLIIEKFICSYEKAFITSSQVKACSTNVFDFKHPSDSALYTFFQSDYCSVIYPDTLLNDESLFSRINPNYYAYDYVVDGKASRQNKKTRPTGKME
jgi:hypothetical protein